MADLTDYSLHFTVTSQSIPMQHSLAKTFHGIAFRRLVLKQHTGTPSRRLISIRPRGEAARNNWSSPLARVRDTKVSREGETKVSRESRERGAFWLIIFSFYFPLKKHCRNPMFATDKAAARKT